MLSDNQIDTTTAPGRPLLWRRKLLIVRTRQHGRPFLPRLSEHGWACIYIRLLSDRKTTLVEVQDENVKLPEPTSVAWMTKTVRTGPAPHTPLQWT